MSPDEALLKQALSANPADLHEKARTWRNAVDKLDDLHAELTRAKNRVDEAWPEGSDAEAAQCAFDQKLKSTTKVRDDMNKVASGTERAANALSKAQTAYRTLPTVPGDPGPVPDKPNSDADLASILAYSAAKGQHAGAVQARNTAITQREAAASAAVEQLNTELAAAQADYSKAAPYIVSDVDSGSPGGSSAIAGPGSQTSAAPVIGGTTSVAGMVGGATLGRRPGVSRGPSVAAPTGSATPTNQPTTDGSVAGPEGGLLGDRPAAQDAGQLGGGGIAGATGGGAVAGAARRIFGRMAYPQVLTRGDGTSGVRPSAPLGRSQTPGTAGRTTAPASAPRQGSTLGSRPSAPGSGARPGSAAPGRTVSPGSGAREGSTLGSRPSAPGSGARPGSMAPGRTVSSAGGRSSAAGRGTSVPAGSSPQSGSAQSSAGQVRPTTNTGTKPGGTTAGKNAAGQSASAGGRADSKRKQQTRGRKRRRFTDDWKDGDDQAYPPVLQ